MKVKATLAAVVLLCGGLFIYQSTAAPAAKVSKAELGKVVPNFTLKDAYGKTFSLDDFKGKTVVLEWLNQGCPVSKRCHNEQLMQKTYAKYAAKGVVWLGIDTTPGAKPEANRVYGAQQHLAYPVLHDPAGRVGRMFGAATTPHMFVIAKSGKLAYSGALDDDPRGASEKKKNYVAAALDAVLAGKEVTQPRTKSYGCAVKYGRGRSGS